MMMKHMSFSLFVAAAVLSVASVDAGTIRIPDAPFDMPDIVVPRFADRDFSIVAFGAKEGEKATAAFASAMEACSGSVRSSRAASGTSG